MTHFELCRKCKTLLAPAGRVHHETGIRFLKLRNLEVHTVIAALYLKGTQNRKNKRIKDKKKKKKIYLFSAARAIVVLMPKAVHGGVKKANPHHKWHHARDNSCQTWFGPMQKLNRTSFFLYFRLLAARINEQNDR